MTVKLKFFLKKFTHLGMEYQNRKRLDGEKTGRDVNFCDLTRVLQANERSKSYELEIIDIGWGDEDFDKLDNFDKAVVVVILNLTSSFRNMQHSLKRSICLSVLTRFDCA